MPVLMRGGGGGKKIKDATAVPSDVAAGKVFYNNDGRQVGTGEMMKCFQFHKNKGEPINWNPNEFLCYGLNNIVDNGTPQPVISDFGILTSDGDQRYYGFGDLISVNIPITSISHLEFYSNFLQDFAKVIMKATNRYIWSSDYIAVMDASSSSNRASIVLRTKNNILTEIGVACYDRRFYDTCKEDVRINIIYK